MYADSDTFARGLVAECPALQPIFEEHMRANDELLAHLFMEDVTRFVVDATTKPELRQPLELILNTIEEGLKLGSDDVEGLIVVSFVENLLGEDDAVSALLPLMGPGLREWVQRICM